MQMGTLGAGNHYAEIQVVEEVFDADAARKMGIDRVLFFLGWAFPVQSHPADLVLPRCIWSTGRPACKVA